MTIDEEQVERLLVNSSENLKEFIKNWLLVSNIDYTSLKFFFLPYEGKQLHDRSKINLLRCSFQIAIQDFLIADDNWNEKKNFPVQREGPVIITFS